MGPRAASSGQGKGVRNWDTGAPPAPPDFLEAVPFKLLMTQWLIKQEV